VRSDLGRRAARLALLMMLAALCVGAAPEVPEGPTAAPAAPVQHEGAPGAVPVHDALYRLEFTLPAPFWQCADNRELVVEARRAQGGCTPAQQVPDSLLYMLRHKDAQVLGRIELVQRSFLARDKAGLEEYVDARMAAVGSEAGGAMQDTASSYTTSGGLIVHRLDFTVPAGSGGGCMSRGRGGPAMRHSVVHYFIRPKGADALLFALYLSAPADAFARLKPEIDSIIGSVRYAGEPDAEFFVPDAPPEKLLTAKDAVKSKPGALNWLMPVGMVLVIWLMIRRKKQNPA
jgi:hypothetical protein